MLYTINQISLRLAKAPKTIYRAHKQYNLGKLYDVAEGRRLLFTEQELDQLENVIFVDKRKEKLLQNEKVREIVSVLKTTPMTLYNLSKKTHISKGTLQSYIMSMSYAFTNLAEDDSGVLYFLDYVRPPDNSNARIRRVYYSVLSNKYVYWETYSNVEAIKESNYILVGEDKCLYLHDKFGKFAYENDIVLYNNERCVINEDMQGDFIIVSNIYEEKEDD